MTTATSAIKNLIFAIAMILPASVLAQDQSRMEAAALACPNGNCGMRMMKLGGLEAVAKLQKINIYGTDDRKDLTEGGTVEQKYLPIGVMKPNIAVPNGHGGLTSENAQATAFLISPCLILSNYHAMYGDDKDGPDADKNYSASFTIGASGSKPLTATARPLEHGEYMGGGKGDWVLAKLDTCLGARADVGWMETSAIPYSMVEKFPAATAGYFSDRNLSKLHLDPSCRVRGVENATLLHDCANRTGTSGSPIFTMKNGLPYVFAMQSGMKIAQPGVIEYSDETANVGVSMAEIMATGRVQEQILLDKRTVPDGNPNKRPATTLQTSKSKSV